MKIYRLHPIYQSVFSKSTLTEPKLLRDGLFKGVKNPSLSLLILKY